MSQLSFTSHQVQPTSQPPSRMKYAAWPVKAPSPWMVWKASITGSKVPDSWRVLSDCVHVCKLRKVGTKKAHAGPEFKKPMDHMSGWDRKGSVILDVPEGDHPKVARPALALWIFTP
jgi:hypothetical protein